MEYNDLVRSLRQCGKWQGEVRYIGRETQCKGCAYHDAVKDVCKSWDCKTHEDHIMLDAADAIEVFESKAIELMETAAEWNAKYYALYDSQPQWTAVEDALPDESGRYLVFLDYYYFESKFGFTPKDLSYVTEMYFDKAQMLWDDNAASQSFNAVLSAVSRNEAQAVTHWMPLPAPPQENDI